jgi:GNAT superfamily N-acetyltransferase
MAFRAREQRVAELNHSVPTDKGMIEFGSAETSQAAEISVLLHQLGYPVDAATVEQRLARQHSLPTSHVIVATREGRVIGLSTLAIIPTLHRSGDICRITAFVIDANERRSGVGRELVRAIEAYAREQACFRVEVTSAGKRADAHAFYLALGFQELPKRFVKDLQ